MEKMMNVVMAATLVCGLTTPANAENFLDLEFPTLEVPEMKIESFDLTEPVYQSSQPDFRFDRVSLTESTAMELTTTAGKWKQIGRAHV